MFNYIRVNYNIRVYNIIKEGSQIFLSSKTVYHWFYYYKTRISVYNTGTFEILNV